MNGLSEQVKDADYYTRIAIQSMKQAFPDCEINGSGTIYKEALVSIELPVYIRGNINVQISKQRNDTINLVTFILHIILIEGSEGISAALKLLGGIKPLHEQLKKDSNECTIYYTQLF